jgi:hypothetical protein
MVSVRGPALGFDPQYVDFVISAWRQQGFPTLSADELQRIALERAKQVFTEQTMMGLVERQAKLSAAKAAIALLKALKLVKQISSGSGSARIVRVETTPLGQEIFGEEPTAGNIRLRLVGLLVKNSPPVTAVLRSFEKDGPLSRPVANPLPGTPRKGAAFNRGVEEGLAQYESQGSEYGHRSAHTGVRQTATQRLKAAGVEATNRHPVSQIPSFEKVVMLAVELGLLWTDVQPINQAIGVESIGLAAVSRDGAFIPNVPSWKEIGVRFQETLRRVYLARVDSSGLTTIATLRGGIGRELGLSAAAVDAYLRLTREAGDRGECQFTLQFEPNDDLLYAADRHPLIWHGTAFDFVELHVRQGASPVGIGAAPSARSGRGSFN